MTTNSRKTPTEPTAAELSRLAVTQAREQFAIRQEEARQAAEAAEEVVARLAGGDDTPTAADLSLTDYAVNRAGLLVKAAEAKVKTAERALINDDTELAELFRPIMDEVYGGRVPIVVTGVPADAEASTDGEPVLFIVQPQPTKTAGGIMAGLVELVFIRPDLFAPLDAEKVEERCRALGYAVQPRQLAQAPAGTMRRDGLRLTVHGASHPVPVMSAAPSDDAVRDFARTVNGDLGQAVTGVSAQPTYTGQAMPGKASSDLLNVRLPDAAQRDGGTVRITVETSHKVLRGARLPEDYANLRLRDTVAALDGHVAHGVGRVVAAEVVDIDMGDPARPDAARAPWTVTARFVLAYRLA